MTRPQDFGFDDEAALLRDAARRLFTDLCPQDVLHRLVAADSSPARASACVWDRTLWHRMQDLGWTAIAVPSAAGGFGMSLTAIAGLAEQVGRFAVPSPLLSTLCATYVLAACDSEAATALLRRIVDGAAVSLAIMDRRGVPGRTDITEHQNTLTGTAWYVQDARKADAFIALADDSLYIVDAAEVTVVPDAINDLTRDQARLVLQNAPTTRIATTEATKVLQAATPAILVILAADMVGAAEWQLQTTAEYARTRVQFDRPIGFFQAVKHPLVNMMVDIDAARSLVYDAACAFDHEPEHAELRARMAKSAASDVASFCSGRSVQLHGGIGFTWECAVQIYFKRQKHSEVLFGDGPYQRARLAERLIGPL